MSDVTNGYRELPPEAEVAQEPENKRSPDSKPIPTRSQGTAIDLPDPEPWPDTVDGAELVSDLTAVIERHVVLPKGGALVVVLWAILSHKFDDFYVCPRLSVSSATLGSGKTTLLKCLVSLVPRPLLASNISPAAIFRTIDAEKPTLLIDEGDTFLQLADEMRGLLNSGHDRSGAYVIRAEGQNFTPRKFSTWCPMAFALIGKLPDTLESRSIVIRIERKRPDDRVSTLRADRMDPFKELARKIARWAADHDLSDFDPVVPDTLQNRNADNWRPMFAIADAIGGDVPARIRQIALSMDGERELTPKEQLLADIKVVFDAAEADKLASQSICEELAKMEDRPWPEWRNGKSITQRQLAAQLKPFGITPSTTRLKSGQTPKGYTRQQFENAWSRHVPPDTSATPPQPAVSNSYSNIPSATLDLPVADQKNPKPPLTNTCGVVADRNGETVEKPPLSDIERARLATQGDDPDERAALQDGDPHSASIEPARHDAE